MIKYIKKIHYCLIGLTVILALSITQTGFASANLNVKTPVFYVTDNFPNHHFIAKIDGTGKIIKQWESAEPKLYGIAKDSKNNVYVTSTDSSEISRISKYNSKGDLIKKWRSPASLIWFGVALDSKNNVYVTDFAYDRVQKFTSDGTYLADINTAQGPIGIAINSKDEIYVVNYVTCLIEKFDINGKLIKSWGIMGTGDGQFINPHSIAIDNNNNVYVVDQNNPGSNPRIQKFDSNGVFIKKWDTEIDDGGLGWITIDNNNNIYLADEFGSRIIKYDSNGTQLAIWNFEKTSRFTSIVFSLE